MKSTVNYINKEVLHMKIGDTVWVNIDGERKAGVVTGVLFNRLLVKVGDETIPVMIG
jgi:hypothetical protein